jgi:class 3 adenylate cyclase
VTRRSISDMQLSAFFLQSVGRPDEVLARTSTSGRRWKEVLATHDDVVRSELLRFQGRAVKTTGGGFLATFDGPARAVHCAHAMVDRLRELDVHIRAGVHTSEVEMLNGDVSGVGVPVAARIMAMAHPDQVLVSGVVRDLSLGSKLTFLDRGRHTLKGVPGEWHLFSAA